MGRGELENSRVFGELPALAWFIIHLAVPLMPRGSRAAACRDMASSSSLLHFVGLQAPNAVGQAAEDEWVRFTATDDSIGVLETGVQLHMVPAEPAAWKLEWVFSLQQSSSRLGWLQPKWDASGLPFWAAHSRVH